MYPSTEGRMSEQELEKFFSSKHERNETRKPKDQATNKTGSELLEKARIC